jgi:hypothetical protein
MTVSDLHTWPISSFELFQVGCGRALLHSWMSAVKGHKEHLDKYVSIESWIAEGLVVRQYHRNLQ